MDPYTVSSNEIVQENDAGELASIHQRRRRCTQNPFMNKAFCDKMHQKEMDEYTAKQDKALQAQRAADAQQNAPPTRFPPFKPPPLNDPEFNTKWTNCFAGPRHSSCPSNYVTRNDYEPKRPDCTYGPVISKYSFYPQQRLVAEYINPSTPYRGLLCYHGLGSGKTIAMISVLSRFLQDEPTRTVLLVAPPKLIQNFKDDLSKTDNVTLFGTHNISDTERAERIHRQINLITFQKLANRLNGKTSWDLPVNGIKTPSTKATTGFGALSDGTYQADSDAYPLLDNTLVMIDEAQDLVTPKDAGYPPEKDAYTVVAALRRATQCRILLMSATPMRNEPFELGVLLNILKPADDPLRFPEVLTTMGNRRKKNNTNQVQQVQQIQIVDLKATRQQFNDHYVQMDENGRPEKTNHEQDFLDRCKGLISYFPIDNLYTKFPKVFEKLVEVPLSDTTFKAIQDRMKAEQATLFKQSGPHASILDHKRQCVTSRMASNVLGHTKSRVLAALQSSRPGATAKLDTIVHNIGHRASIGKQFVFSAFDLQGCMAIAKRLQDAGWTRLEGNDLKQYLKPQYQSFREINKESFATRFHLPLKDPDCVRAKPLPRRRQTFVMMGLRESDGSEFRQWKQKLMMLYFNTEQNTHGDHLNVMLANRGYAKGITLLAVRSVHIAEPPLSVSDANQILARGVRSCSHRKLPFPKEWTVTAYTYISTHPVLGSFTSGIVGKEGEAAYAHTQANEARDVARERDTASSDSSETATVEPSETAYTEPPVQAPAPAPEPAPEPVQAPAQDVDTDIPSPGSVDVVMPTPTQSSTPHSTDSVSVRSDAMAAPSSTESSRSNRSEASSDAVPDAVPDAVSDAVPNTVSDAASNSLSNRSEQREPSNISYSDLSADAEHDEGVSEYNDPGVMDKPSPPPPSYSPRPAARPAARPVVHRRSSRRSSRQSSRQSSRRASRHSSRHSSRHTTPPHHTRPRRSRNRPPPKTGYLGKHWKPFHERTRKPPKTYRAAHPTGGGSAVSSVKPPSRTRKAISHWSTHSDFANAFSTKEQCDRSEFCQWNDGRDTCMALPIDLAVRKMSLLRSKVNARFLELLQIAAIDCLVFRELHDDRSRPCHRLSPLDPTQPEIRPYRGYNESQFSDSETTHTAKTQRRTRRSSIASDSEDAAVETATKCSVIQDANTCREHKGCYVEKGRLWGFTCKNRESPKGTAHHKCPVYYDDKIDCNSDPMCRWAPTQKGTLKSNYTCRNRYMERLSDETTMGSPHVIALMTSDTTDAGRDKAKFLFYPLHPYRDRRRTEKDMRVVIKHFKKRCRPESHDPDTTYDPKTDNPYPDPDADAQPINADGKRTRDQPKLPLLNVLEELYELVEQDPQMVYRYEPAIRKVTQMDLERNAAEWEANHVMVQKWMDGILSLYEAVKRTDNLPSSKPILPTMNSPSPTPSTPSTETNTPQHLSDVSSTSETGASEFSESGESSDSEYSTSNVINTTDERIFPDTPLDQIQKRMLLCVQRDDRGSLALNVERKRHNLLELRNRGVDVFHYSFHVYFNERHYYFDSRERPDAGIRLTQLGAMKQVHKHIELMDLSIRMVFYVHRVFLRQVEMRVYVRPEGADLDNMDTPVRTVFVDKDSRRHHLLSASGCDRLW